MGLGLHGGGLATVRYLVERGAECVVTDLRDENDLRPSLEGIPDGVRLVLGGHEERDFERADLVVKNPAVPRTAPLLRSARAITTDIALFLAERGDGGPLVAITGTKGKSTTAGATAHALAHHPGGVRLGGNITISPLSFLEEITSKTPVVLELSSFQLGDLHFCREFNTQRKTIDSAVDPRILRPELRPHVAIITSIFRDHQDYYGSMDSYIADKRRIYATMPDDGICVFGDDEWGRRFGEEAHALGVAKDHIVLVGTEVPDGRGFVLPEHLTLGGLHMRHNLAMAAVAAEHCGAPRDKIVRSLASFGGVTHRMEVVGRTESITFINDTAATIPEASLAAVDSLVQSDPGARIILIAGGTDKKLDLAPLIDTIEKLSARGGSTLLLAGSATDNMLVREPSLRAVVEGPFVEFSRAVDRAVAIATKGVGDAIVILSPGCASFGMFRNEFDRGDRFRALLRPHLTAD